MRRLPLDRQAQLLALGAALPVLVAAEILLWTAPHTARTRWILTVLFLVVWIVCARALREKIVRPLQTVSNMISAIGENDFSIRARGGRHDDALGEVLLEVNALTDTLREQRLGALEATALLHKVMEEIDVAVFAFDREKRLRLVNRAGERLLALPAPRLLGRSAEDLHLVKYVDSETPHVVDASFPGASGRWEIRPGFFRQGGVPHRLLVIADVSRPLREEERQAWQRLIRVLGHELNNSLAPIQSIAASLSRTLAMDSLPGDWREDTCRGLSVIAARAEALSRFTAGYARLARLPEPRPEILEIGDLIRRVTRLETRLRVVVESGPPARLRADPDQLEQLLINLVRNAADAALQTGGGVALGWRRSTDSAGQVEVWVEDDGPGLSGTTNLFVPFFTTKSGGSGIGLVLSRQIADAHGGTLTLENREDGPGAIARVRFPLYQDGSASAQGIGPP